MEQKNTPSQNETPSQPPKQVTVDGLLNTCMDAPGYVVFAGVLSSKKDAAGNPLIDWSYIRSNFSFEDTRRAVREFNNELLKDINAL